MIRSTLHRWATLTLATILPFAAAEAGIVRFTAEIDSEQETTGSDSTATGTAVLFYDATSNTFDLIITLEGFANTLTNSHIHEAPPGQDAPPAVDLGPEAQYTRDGETLSGTFANLEYTGDPEALLSGNAYVNFHTGDWPGGEIRGQLIPDPVKLTAILAAENEIGSHAPVDSDAYGAVQATYDPATNMITTLVCVYNFTNTLTNSHIHEAPIDASGDVTLGFGPADQYENSGTTYVQQFGPSAYPGSPVALLSEGAYVNVHSDVYAPGEIRGQLFVVDPHNAGRLVNVSARGRVGTGDDVLISGFFVAGLDPVRVLITGRGPSLAGVTEPLENPMLQVFDFDNNLLFTIDDVGDAPFQDAINGANLVNFAEGDSGVLLVLPPGGYTGVVSGVDGGTGVGLAEAFEVAW